MCTKYHKFYTDFEYTTYFSDKMRQKGTDTKKYFEIFTCGIML